MNYQITCHAVMYSVFCFVVLPLSALTHHSTPHLTPMHSIVYHGTAHLVVEVCRVYVNYVYYVISYMYTLTSTVDHMVLVIS